MHREGPGDEGPEEPRDGYTKIEKLQRHDAQRWRQFVRLDWTEKMKGHIPWRMTYDRKRFRAWPACRAFAGFSGILAGKFASSYTSWRYVDARRKMKTTLTSKKRKYLEWRMSVVLTKQIKLQTS